MDKSENKRLKAIREYFRENTTEFAKRLGISQSTLSQMEIGERVKDKKKVYIGVSKGVKKALYSSLNVNKAWFETGKGEMFTASKPEDDEDYKAKYFAALEEIARLSKLITKDLIKK